jgi:hypothetical protein
MSQKPLYIQDLILGLQSDDHDRYTTAINEMEQFIRDVDSNDLDAMCSELMQNVFRAQNKFELDGFVETKYKAIVAVLVKVPRIASSELAERMLDSEASLGEKLMLIECMPAAAVELSN